MRKIAVCYPGDMASVFMAPFASMVNIQTPENAEVKWFRGVGWCQARRRTHACEQALEWGADLIAQFDLDQVYEPDVLTRLMARIDEGYPIIAAMVPGRTQVPGSKVKPFERLAWKSTENGKAFEPIDPDDGDVQEADFPTSACVMFRAGDLERLKKPWYYNKFDSNDWKMTQGEDGAFFLRMARDLDIKSYVDTTIRVKHAHVFEIDESFPDRFADWSE